MKQVIFFLLPTFILLGEPTCKKCEVIRDYNKEHPGDFEYYDDYLKAQGTNISEVESKK